MVGDDRGRARQRRRAPVTGRASAHRRRRAVGDDRSTRRSTPARRARVERVVVAFSGGADSALVARVATDVLGPDHVLCVTAVSASLAPEELADCRALAARVGSALARGVHRRARRPRLRGQRRRPLLPLQGEPPRRPGPAGRGRVGHRACSGSTSTTSATTVPASAPRPSGARASRWSTPGSPRTTCAPCRADLGLRTWDKPAAACLASRVPYGTPGHPRAPSRRWPRAESALRALGFRQLRVRHYGDLARIELDGDDLAARRGAARRGGGRGARRRVPLRHPRPRGIPVGQPQPRPRRATRAGRPGDDRPP